VKVKLAQAPGALAQTGVESDRLLRAGALSVLTILIGAAVLFSIRRKRA
jgi:LPXTG-motif cell wall-anchored protein